MTRSSSQKVKNEEISMDRKNMFSDRGTESTEKVWLWEDLRCVHKNASVDQNGEPGDNIVSELSGMTRRGYI